MKGRPVAWLGMIALCVGFTMMPAIKAFDRQDSPANNKGGNQPKKDARTPVDHDTGNKFNPSINGPLDPDTKLPKKVSRKVRIKRYRGGKKEVTYPPGPTVYPLDPVTSASGQGTTPNHPTVKVSGYVHTVSKPKTDPPTEPPPDQPGFGDFHGNMVLFCVDGCDDATFYQFYNQTFSFSNKGEQGSNTDWHYDTSDGKPKAYKNLPDQPAAGASPEPAMYDAPGLWGEPADTVPPLSVAPHAGDTETRTDEFKTFVCCEGKLIGFWSWTQTMTFTWQKTGGWDTPSVTAAAPAWNNDPTTGGKPYNLLAKDKFCGAKK